MADNWSPSVLTLASQGDWATWTFDIPDSTAVEHLNGDNTALNGRIAIRGAFPGPSASAGLAVLVNDGWYKNMQAATSPSGWVSADRFQLLTADIVQGWQAVGLDDAGAFASAYGFGYPIPAGVTGPFVVGTNTIRVLNLGFTSAEIDFVYIGTGESTVSVPGLGSGDAAESPPTGFAGHVDPNVDTDINSDSDRQWLLKAPEASTGTAERSLITAKKFCPRASTFLPKVLLTDLFGSPITGATLWLHDPNTGTLTSTTTDGDGIAELDLAFLSSAQFFYLGDDDWIPTTLNVSSDERINCGGWHVGNVGLG